LGENTVVVVEKWADLDALNVHRNAQHMIDFRPKVKDYVKSIKLQILKPC
jgi:quinol monooxygenase YgiN